MTSNWNWNRPEDGADGPDSQPTANPPEPLGDQAPPPWSSAAGSGASSVQSHGQSPWDRPAAEGTGTGAEQSYGQTPWDRPVSPSRRAADDEGYGQNPWDRAGSTSAEGCVVLVSSSRVLIAPPGPGRVGPARR